MPTSPTAATSTNRTASAGWWRSTPSIPARSRSAGRRFPRDVYQRQVQDGRKRMPEGRQNYKYLPWSAVAEALGLE